VQQLQPLRRQLHIEDTHTGEISARSAQARNKPELDRVDPYRKDMGMLVVAAFAASAGAIPLVVAITATCRRTRSAASAGVSCAASRLTTTLRAQRKIPHYVTAVRDVNQV